jgi:type I restriction enzyme S subunit
VGDSTIAPQDLSCIPQSSSLSSRRFRPYPEYKDSGVEWLSEVPVHWEIKKIKRLCLVRRGASPRPIDDPVYFDDEGEYSWVRIADVTASGRYLLQTTQRLSELGKSKSVPLEPGELFLSIAATVGKPIITKIKCCIHDGFVYFVGLAANREFLYYAFACGEAYKGLGKLGTQLNLNTDTIGGIYIPVPPKPEQHVIAEFLDRETGKIDALVAKKERLTELLQEKRTALVTRAVTKGLDPDVPMKDSGLEWLGAIPAHWDLKKLKYVVQFIDGDRGKEYPTEQDCVPEGIPFLSSKNIINNTLVLDDLRFISTAKFNSLGRGKLQPGDLVITVRGTIGSVGYFSGDKYSKGFINAQMMIIRAGKCVVPRFLHLITQGRAWRTQLDFSSYGTAQQQLSNEILCNIVSPIPPASEQHAILQKFAPWENMFRRVINRTTRSVNRLREFRTALISAAVTGKIDVREEVA